MTEATILVVEDDRALSEALGDTLELAGYTVRTAVDGRAAMDVLAREPVQLVVTDVHMKGMDGHTLLKRVKAEHPELPVLLMTAYGTIEKAVAAMQEGASDYLVKPFEADVLVEAVGRYVAVGATEANGVIAESPRMRQVLTLASRVAGSEATVMITGESGTGKEVIARYIHGESPRATGPFVAINCAAIPDNMLEATLFGYEKGAFTGAYKRTPGKFEQAQGGTLLLDEISEMDLALQAKLLRVIQEWEVERLGGSELIELDVRVLATSNRDMKEAVRAGRFREDLYYRLNVFPLQLPALRERPEDIAPLAEQLLHRAARRMGGTVPRLSRAATERLSAHTWPGNVRELDNMMQRALILHQGEEIDTADLHFESVSETLPPAPADPVVETLDEDLKTREYRLILDALKVGSRKRAAQKLGISERTLRYKLARLREAGMTVPEKVGA